ncbi:MAG: type II toxin-antitoxin system prevent-host-death family antitoxin [Verrucomicrobia bacterium]|nr:MAG: type II toxin-antitoxin system prevent-host-death family antitoxin [Verrucomicrobiota bacterium]
METINATELRKDAYNIIDSIIQTHRLLQIKVKTGSVVMIASSDWSAIQETLYLDSIPGMTDSILEGMKISADKCSKELKW